MKEKGIALLYLSVFLPAAIEKLIQPKAPTWFIDQFSPTILGWIPDLLPIQFYALGVLEALVAIVMILVLFRKDSLHWLKVGLILSFLTFIALGFGQRLSHKFDGAAQLFFYASLTFLVLRNLNLLDIAKRGSP